MAFTAWLRGLFPGTTLVDPILSNPNFSAICSSSSRILPITNHMEAVGSEELSGSVAQELA